MKLKFPRKPTHAWCHPGINLAPGQLLGYEGFSRRSQARLHQLNTPMPCPPRGTVPVNQSIVEGCFTLNAHFAFREVFDCLGYDAQKPFSAVVSGQVRNQRLSNAIDPAFSCTKRVTRSPVQSSGKGLPFVSGAQMRATAPMM